MASRSFVRDLNTLEKGVVVLFGRLTFAGSGAVTLDAAKSKGIKSVAHNSAGDYTVTLSDRYQRLLNISPTFKGTSAPAAPAMWLKADGSASATPTFEVVFHAAGTPTDPASGEEITFKISLSNSTAL